MAKLDFPSATEIAIGDTYTGALTTWTWDGSKWTAFGTISLDDLTDVALADEKVEDVLIYNGADWQNQPDVDGGSF
jgi:hypothetical protein